MTKWFVLARAINFSADIKTRHKFNRITSEQKKYFHVMFSKYINYLKYISMNPPLEATNRLFSTWSPWNKFFIYILLPYRKSFFQEHTINKIVQFFLDLEFFEPKGVKLFEKRDGDLGMKAEMGNDRAASFTRDVHNYKIVLHSSR